MFFKYENPFGVAKLKGKPKESHLDICER